jgi:hypothetical protein
VSLFSTASRNRRITVAPQKYIITSFTICSLRLLPFSPPRSPRPSRHLIYGQATRGVLSESSYILGSVQPHNSVSSPSFLNRDQTISHLTLTQDGAPVPLDPIRLPNLKEYSGPSSSLPVFCANSSHISCVALFWYLDDLNVEPPLLQLSRMASLAKFTGICTANDLPPSAILAAVAAHLPQITGLLLYIRPRTIVVHRSSPSLLFAGYCRRFYRTYVVEGSYGRRVEIHLHVGFNFTLPCPYLMLQHLFVL